MQTKYVVPVIVAGLALGGAAAFAASQSSPPSQDGPMWRDHHWRMDKKDMAEWHADRCANRYARAVGAMAYLETRLALKDAQKPAFDHWKGVVLSSAKSASDQCAATKLPDKQLSLVARMKFREKMLESHLTAMKAQMPALETLTASLDKKQDRILERAVGRLMHHEGRRGFHHGFGPGPMQGRGMGPGPMQGPGPDGPPMPG